LSRWKAFGLSSRNGHRNLDLLIQKSQIILQGIFLMSLCETGTFHVHLRILVLKFRMRLAIIGMSGSMHLLAISPPPNNGPKNMAGHLQTGGARVIQTSPMQKFTISLEKTSPTFTHCSGQQCSKLQI